MTGGFDRATAVRRRVGADGRDHTEGSFVYDTAIDAGWDIGGNANGGYLMAVAARAMADAAGRPPLALTAHFLAPGKVGPCEVAVDVHRAGRRMATASAVLRSAIGDVIRLIGTFAEQGESGPAVIDAAPPALPPIDECVLAAPPGGDSGFGRQVRNLVRPADIGFAFDQPTGAAEIAGWFAFADEQPIDAFGLLLAADAFAPVVFHRPEFPVAWAPTLELTVHVRGVPAPGPLRCVFRSRFMQTGMFEEDGQLWDTTDTLVAQSRQLALIPRANG